MKKLIESIGNWEHESIQEAKTRTQELTGGLGDNLNVPDVDKNELLMGLRVELEHCGQGLDISDETIQNFVDDNLDDINDDIQKALRISMDITFDHLAEIKDYYTRLANMEAEAKGEKTD